MNRDAWKAGGLAAGPAFLTDWLNSAGQMKGEGRTYEATLSYLFIGCHDVFIFIEMLYLIPFAFRSLFM